MAKESKIADLKFTLAYVNKMNEEMIAEIIKYLRSKNKFATGRLIRSFRYKVKKTVEAVISEIQFEDYGAYVNFGRMPGKFPPQKQIEKWMKVKGIPMSASFPIRRAIAKKGIKGVNFYELAQNLYVKKGDAPLKNAFENDVKRIVEYQINEMKKNLK